jgi:hypothetical protein
MQAYNEDYERIQMPIRSGPMVDWNFLMRQTLAEERVSDRTAEQHGDVPVRTVQSTEDHCAEGAPAEGVELTEGSYAEDEKDEEEEEEDESNATEDGSAQGGMSTEGTTAQDGPVEIDVQLRDALQQIRNWKKFKKMAEKTVKRFVEEAEEDAEEIECLQNRAEEDKKKIERLQWRTDTLTDRLQAETRDLSEARAAVEALTHDLHICLRCICRQMELDRDGDILEVPWDYVLLREARGGMLRHLRKSWEAGEARRDERAKRIGDDSLLQ